jgi:ATP-dependent DNA helicase RecG
MPTTKEFTLTTDAPNSISLQGPTAGALREVIEGQWDEAAHTFTCAFTKENSHLLRQFLRGRDAEISAKDRRTLRFLADSVEDGTDLKKYDWQVRLIDLTKRKIEITVNKKKTVRTGWDLLHYLPLRFIDKTNPQSVDELKLGDWGVVVGFVVGDAKFNRYTETLRILVQDINGKRISISFFGKNQGWREKKFRNGDEVVLYGNYNEYVDKRTKYRYPEIKNGSIEKLIDVNGGLPMIPIYPQKTGDKTRQLQSHIMKLLDKIVWIEDPVPELILKHYNLMNRTEAYRALHLPQNREEQIRARERLAFDEFIRLQVFFSYRRDELEEAKGRTKTHTALAQQFVDALPFTFTGAQTRVAAEIQADMASPHPMHRLLQGEVGSGKTELATLAALTAVGSGYQAAFLAPTDILAGQSYDRIQRDLASAGIPATVHLLTGRTRAKAKRDTLAGMKDGTIDIVVGTHAIIQQGVEFGNLGLVIVDEQHKFGNEQRNALIEATHMNGTPDFLAMSATPIPRTTSQVIYGDMDVSVIDELPPGRIPIETYWEEDPQEGWDKIEEQVAQGRQAYVVASLVDDSETLANVESATQTYEMLRSKFSGLRVGLLHGKLDSTSKQEVIDSFYRGETQVLVATTVVEVGVNVPNASVMMILNANRFGIASLHQIRGRVGRGKYASYCYLIGEANNGEAEERLKAMVESLDGFYLAEKDLEIRGEGSLFGNRQSGQTDNFAANLREHRPLLEKAKIVAKQASKSDKMRAEVDFLYGTKSISA